MLNRSQLHKFKNYLIKIIDKYGADTAYSTVFKFLDDVIVEFYSNSQNPPAEDIQKLHNAKTTHWTKYHRLQQKFNILTKLPQNAKESEKLENAFKKAYETNFAKAFDVKDSSDSNIVDLEEISFNLARIFAGGITEGILNNFKKNAPQKFDRKAYHQHYSIYGDLTTTTNAQFYKSFDAAWAGNFSGFIKSALRVISRLTDSLETTKFRLNNLGKTDGDKEKEILERDKGSRELLLNSFKIAANEAINLINQESKYGYSESQDLIISIVNKRFNKYILKNLAYLFPKDKAVLDKDHPQLYTAAYIACNRAIAELSAWIETGKDVELAKIKLEKAITFKKNLLMFCQPNMVASDFGILNPAFIIKPQSLQDNVQYQNLCHFLAEELKRIKVDVIKADFTSFPKKITLLDRIRDKIRGRNESDEESAKSTIEMTTYIDTFLKNFKLDTIQDFTKLAYGLNQAVFRQDKLHVNIQRSAGIAGSAAHLERVGIYSNSDSKVRELTEKKISVLRSYVNRNSDMIKTIIGKGDKNITIHDLYLELNLSINVRIREEAKIRYHNAVNSFPRTLLNIFWDAGLEQKREIPLTNLMDRLIASKTEDDYIKFFMAANNELLTYKNQGDLRWDSLYKATIQEAMLSVVRHHLLNNDELRLNFSTIQLELIFKYLKANHIDTEDKTYQALSRLINKRKFTEATLPDELQTNPENKKSQADAENDRNKTQKDMDAAKLEKFKVTLLQKLESNMLADMVISTGRVQINDRDIGVVAKKISVLLSAVNGTAADFISNQASSYDKSKQTAESEGVSNLIAKCGGTQMMFNEIVASAVSELCLMFESAIKNMFDEDEVAKVAEVFFIRMYTALRMSNDEKVTFKLHNLNIRDLLIESVFRVRKDSSLNPFRKVHYRCIGDTSWFPKTTVQGLVDGVSIYSEEKVLQVSNDLTPSSSNAQLSPPAENSSKPAAQIELIDESALRDPIEKKPTQQPPSSTRVIGVYLRPTAIESESPEAQTQMEKYKFCRASKTIAEHLAEDLRRFPYDRENKILNGEKISPEKDALITKCLEETRNVISR